MPPTDNNPSPQRCPRCGAELPAHVPPEQCPRCLLGLAMNPQPETGPGGTVVGPPDPPPEQQGLPQPGEQLGHYRIIRLLGGGGMGAVFEAEDLENGRRVALKVLSQALDSPDARQRFFREGRLAASLNHPNSVYIFGTEEIGGTPIITMELMPSGTLQDRVRARGPLPVGEAVDCVLQIVDGLEAAHRLGILHRDIKPSNCYLGEDGTVKIGDFGLSISTTVRTEPALTATGAFLGTPAFCPPEQLRGEELSARSDMYSVGATLYFLLTGRTPFEAPNMVQLLATVLEQYAPSPRQLRADIPKGLAKAVLRCLEKESSDRFKNYTDLRQALAPYSSTAPSPATLSLRFLAGGVDTVLLSLLTGLINLALFGNITRFMGQVLQLSPKVLVCMLGGVCVMVLYYAVFEGLWGAALGKTLCRLRVVGPGRNPPGFLRALVRALLFVLLPMVPFWLVFGRNPGALLGTSPWAQMGIGGLSYLIMALLFVTARRRNGFAAVQDLLTETRVVSRAALSVRPVLPMGEVPPPAVESALTVGPYHVLQTLAEAGDAKWLLAYDLKLLRKVWVRVLPPGTPPIAPALRSLGRIGRLRWLTGKRSAEENWDAFEALSGEPFLKVIQAAQSWQDVRYWLSDLATELSAAERDNTVPALALDRIWVTSEGRAKLLDFPAPSLGLGQWATFSSSNAFLNAVATAALTGSPDGAAQPAGEVALPLPLHARSFLKSLPQLARTEVIAAVLKPLLARAAAVSRLRRAALVGGCIAFPILGCLGGLFATSVVQGLIRGNPGAMELNSLLHARSSLRFWGGKHVEAPTDRQFALYIAGHYRSLITNTATWSNPYVLSLINGQARKFAEQSVADYPSPTPAEMADANAAVGKYAPPPDAFLPKPTPTLSAMVLAMCLLVYVGLPAVVAALLFRGGVVLLLAGVTYVRNDGVRASRLRLLWRAVVTWGPAVPVFMATILALSRHLVWPAWVALALLGLLAAVSVALPDRGLQDRLAGTWPVPR
jgi:eukaryotic-like serine/threonine-protein kinase